MSILFLLLFIPSLPSARAAGERSGRPHFDPLPHCGSQHRPCIPYQGGKVMSTTRTYAIFWLPKGRHFEPHGSDLRYERLLVQFLGDVGGTPYYGLLTQYSRSPRGKPVKNGPIRNVSAFAASYLDTTPYPTAATEPDPLPESDFRHEIDAIAAKEKWPIDMTSLFFVYVASGVWVCGTLPCKYSPDFCATHWGLSDGPVIAAVEDPTKPRCTPVFRHTPNRDPLADTAIDFSSRELFEAVTDPWPCHGWTVKCGSNLPPLEIGDLCERQYGHRNPDGSDLVLRDHTYLVQKEWSNRAGKCVLASSRYPPPRPSSGGIPADVVVAIVVGLLTTALVVALAVVTMRRRQREFG